MLIMETIMELDIEHASPSIWYEMGKISLKKYNELINMDKKSRVVNSGLMIKEDKTLYETLQEGYEKYTKLLLESNNINESSIFDRSHDAVWLINTIPEITEFGKVKYLIKGSYEMVYKYKKCEFYLESITNKVKTRFVSKSDSPERKELLDLIKEVMVSKSYGDTEKCYDLLHKAKKDLTNNPLCYGDNIINNETSNLNLIKNMIRTFA